VKHAVGIAQGPLDGYGCHLLESIQCMVERRKGGKTGVAAVQCLEGDAVWNYLDRHAWARNLFELALVRIERREPGEVRDLAKNPAVFLVDYEDGLWVPAFLLTGALKGFSVAVGCEGEQEPISTYMWTPKGDSPHIFYHFVCLVENIEKMFEAGQLPYPIERAQLTSGILDLVLESRFQNHERVMTPQLRIRYQASKKSGYCESGPAYLVDPSLLE